MQALMPFRVLVSLMLRMCMEMKAFQVKVVTICALAQICLQILWGFQMFVHPPFVGCIVGYAPLFLASCKAPTGVLSVFNVNLPLVL